MAKKIRSANIKRKTTETDISGKLAIDGTGKTDISTGIGFLDHMLTLFAFHGLFDLAIKAKGDLKVDMHHTNEDVAICLGKAFKEALGDCKGIKRYGSKEVPMDLAAAKVMIDIGGRYAFVWKVPPYANTYAAEGYTIEDGKDLLDTFAKNANINLHIEVYSGQDTHHVLEAIFKAFGIALDEATQIDVRRKGVPSTKGTID
ncbi:MAG: imidazoleglycerol-phosphate dehydratase HisB [Candidatus Omnitrophica bacterium]|nr:imidazoleglycerol-phosphate dehydratase HisB [Candidatus Omnitrophota bacterium]MDD5437173.1 imidazoleglycerol-phosphate dehydratase HisB [Candidatus Omnitrophota bacterium]